MNFILYFSYNLPIYMLGVALLGLIYFLLKFRKNNQAQEYVLFKKYKIYLIINLIFSLIIFLFNIEYIIDSPIGYSVLLLLLNLFMWLTIQLGHLDFHKQRSVNLTSYILVIEHLVRMTLLVLIIFNNQYF